MKKLSLAAFLLLTGCITSQQDQIAADDTKCLSYGVQKGSDQYVACRAQLDRNRAEITASERFARGGGIVGAVQRANQ